MGWMLKSLLKCISTIFRLDSTPPRNVFYFIIFLGNALLLGEHKISSPSSCRI